MKGDFSRDTFDPQKHYSAVLMQQGRVQVDADWNEQQEIQQHRIQTETIDVIGRCGAPKHDAGFTIEASGSEFTIGAGRFYVHGTLCQNEVEVLYSEQPNIIAPEPVAVLLGDTRIGIIYLDVWQRHLTALDAPSIREVALGGPDTTTRLKTIWQVKVLPLTDTSPNDASCEGELAEWNEFIAPSTGTLNARTAVLAATDNPCLIHADAGYLRLENQLYRVEIHQGSNTAQPSFKWSRDNGSIVTQIEAIDGARVTVADLGRDDVLGFAKGQWVEISDDALELDGLPGELLQIVDISNNVEGFPVIELASAPTALTEGVKSELHPKLRRWEQNSEAIAIGEDWIDLEEGIQVQFSEGAYQTGDYWLIPARTATGQIEWSMTDDEPPAPIPQPPLGIKHHYCRLAIARLGGIDDDGNLTELDILFCDHLFPPLTEIEPQGGEACCTVVVQPGEDIQQAIDSLPFAGGCICLKTGTHVIVRPIRIRKSNIVLKGESPGTRVRTRISRDASGLLAISSLLDISSPEFERTNQVVIEQIYFEAFSRETTSLQLNNFTQTEFEFIRITNCDNVRVLHCRFRVDEVEVGQSNQTLPSIRAAGISIINSTQILLQENGMFSTTVGIVTEGCSTSKFAGNQLTGSVFRLNDNTLNVPLGYVGILHNHESDEQNVLRDNDCQIVDCAITNFAVGIVVGRNSDRCQVANNQILRPSNSGLPVESNELYFSDGEPFIYGIITFANYCTVASNYLELNSPSYGGMRIFGSYTCVDKNVITSNLPSEARILPLPMAIFLGRYRSAANSPRLGHCVVTNNQILDTSVGIALVNTEHIQISTNQIATFQGETSPYFGIYLSRAMHTTLNHNQIRSIRAAIVASRSGTNNRVSNNYLSDGICGIMFISQLAATVNGNQITNMEHAGIAITNLADSTKINNNQLDNCGYRPLLDSTPVDFDFDKFSWSLSLENGVGVGISVRNSRDNLTIDSCQILDTGISRAGETEAESRFISIYLNAATACQIKRNQVLYSDFETLPEDLENFNRLRHRALEFAFPPSTNPNEIPYPESGSAVVTNNVFQGLNFFHLVEFKKNFRSSQIGFYEVNFSHNQCYHRQTQILFETSAIAGADSSRNISSTVAIWGRNLAVMSNQIKADISNLFSIDLSNPEKATLMGNITSGRIDNFGLETKPPQPEDFNFYS